jgi:hypothetical protein
MSNTLYSNYANYFDWGKLKTRSCNQSDNQQITIYGLQLITDILKSIKPTTSSSFHISLVGQSLPRLLACSILQNLNEITDRSDVQIDALCCLTSEICCFDFV